MPVHLLTTSAISSGVTSSRTSRPPCLLVQLELLLLLAGLLLQVAEFAVLDAGRLLPVARAG